MCFHLYFIYKFISDSYSFVYIFISIYLFILFIFLFISLFIDLIIIFFSVFPSKMKDEFSLLLTSNPAVSSGTTQPT
jgi:hypothetical protein